MWINWTSFVLEFNNHSWRPPILGDPTQRWVSKTSLDLLVWLPIPWVCEYLPEFYVTSQILLRVMLQSSSFPGLLGTWNPGESYRNITRRWHSHKEWNVFPAHVLWGVQVIGSEDCPMQIATVPWMDIHPEVRCPNGGGFNYGLFILFSFWEKTQSEHIFQCSTQLGWHHLFLCVFLSVKDSIWQLPAFQRLDRLRGLGCHRVEVSSQAAGDTTKLDIHYIIYSISDIR